MNPPLLARIDAALAEIIPMDEAGWEPATSMRRQLVWCRALVLGEPREPMPGPFSMGLMATREFDMYGHQPELARLINEIQHAAEALLDAGLQP